MTKEVFGAKAKVYIEYYGELEELGKILSKGLQIPDFWIKNDTDPHHSPAAMSEAFRFESGLNKTNNENWNYEFDKSTKHRLMESATDKMHHLFEWLERYLVDIIEIKPETKK